jgi:putative ABC transport system permease protein
MGVILLAHDLRSSARRLIRSPGFTLVAVLMLALGIGANTSIFSVVDAALIRPLPYPAADHLVRIYSPSKKGRSSISPPDFVDWRADNTVFDGMAAFEAQAYALTGGGGMAEEVDAAMVTQDFFPVLGVSPALGRAFTANDEIPGVNVVVLSDDLWRQRFGGDSGVIGRSIVLDAVPYTVIGVMPRAFNYPAWALLWTPQPFTAHDLATQRGAHYLDVIARLRAGVTLTVARSEMQTIWTRLAQAYPTKDDAHGGDVVTIRQSLVGETRPALLVLWGAVGVVLLIACTNVANLLLARAVTRQREMAIRSALGASRLDLVRTSIVDAVLLAVIGGAAGVGLAGWGIRALLALRPDDPSIAGASIDTTVLILSMAVSLATGLAAGLLPALQMEPRRDVQRAKRTLAIAELALAVVLLTTAGLLVRTFAALRSVDLGYATDHRVTFDIELPDARYDSPEKRAAFFVALTDALRALPGVRNAAATTVLPLSGNAFSMSAYSLDGVKLSDDDQDRLSTQVRISTPGYIASMGIPLESGRWFSADDRRETQPVAVVNEAAAKLIFPGASPIGHAITISTSFGLGPHAGGTIVGVVGNTHDWDLTSPVRPMLYLAHAQFPVENQSVVVWTSSTSATAMRTALAAIDPEVPLFHVSTMAHLADDAVARSRFVMLLLEIFAAVAITMAVVGLYGVIAYSVGARTREIGLRMALGAQRGQVLGLVIRDGFAIGAIGIAAGLVASLGASRLLQGLLFGVSPADLLTLTVTCLVVGAATLAATWLPAWRATKIDPVVAIKSE